MNFIFFKKNLAFMEADLNRTEKARGKNEI